MFPNSNYYNNNPNNANQQPSFKERAKQMWSQVPLFVKFIIIVTCTCYLLSWFTTFFLKSLTNVPYMVIYHFQIWRIFTSVFMTLSIINILFALLAWVPDAIRLESSTGTIKYMITFFTNSLIIQILYIVLCFVLSVFSTGILIMPSSGLWPLIMAEITILCLTNPQNQLMMMFLPCLIPAKYYPWALFGFFTMLNMSLQFDILAGILYGYIFHHFLKSKLQFSDEFIVKVENMPLLNKLSYFSSFVPLSKAISIGGGNMFYAGQNTGVNAFGFGRNNNTNFNNNNNSSNSTQPPTRPQKPVSTPFQGVGSVLGSKKHLNFFLKILLKI